MAATLTYPRTVEYADLVTDWDTAVASMAGALGGDLRAALGEVAAAAERPYYDEGEDQAALTAYYAGTGSDQLGDLVASTHRVKPAYKPARELYPWVDLQPDGKLRSLYTAEEFEPEELIRADFQILQARAATLTQATLLDDNDNDNDDGFAAAAAEVEAQLPFNCEHVVPQSWFAKSEPMRGDLHHLFACESRCNSFRGNTPYAEFPDFPTPAPSTAVGAVDVVRGDCGKSQSAGFEPAHGKGAAARALFYFQLRYPNSISTQEMPQDRWAVAYDWHHHDPVTIWEKHRNAAIFERQGNRNPFIDHPEWLPDPA